VRTPRTKRKQSVSNALKSPGQETTSGVGRKGMGTEGRGGAQSSLHCLTLLPLWPPVQTAPMDDAPVSVQRPVNSSENKQKRDVNNSGTKRAHQRTQPGKSTETARERPGNKVCALRKQIGNKTCAGNDPRRAPRGTEDATSGNRRCAPILRGQSHFAGAKLGQSPWLPPLS